MPMVRCSNNENDRIYAAIVARGVTPASDSTDDLIAAIALIDTRHSVQFQGHYAGSGSGIEYWARVDGAQVSHGFWTDGNGSIGLTV